MKLAAALIAAGAAAILLWPFARDLRYNISKPEFAFWLITPIPPMLFVYYFVGPNFFSHRAQIGFLITGLTLVLTAVTVAIAHGHTNWPILLPLILAAAAVLAAFTRRAIHGPDPDDDWGDW